MWTSYPRPREVEKEPTTKQKREAAHFSVLTTADTLQVLLESSDVENAVLLSTHTVKQAINALKAAAGMIRL